MSTACDTLSPSPAALAGPIPIISADAFLGLESGHDERSSGLSRDAFVDLEDGNGHGPSAGRDEMSIALEVSQYITRCKNYSDCNAACCPVVDETFWSNMETYWQNLRSSNDVPHQLHEHQIREGRPKIIQKSKISRFPHSVIYATTMT